MDSINTRSLCHTLNYHLIIPAIALIFTLPSYGHAERQLLATPRDTTVIVGSKTNLTCIVGESFGEEVADLNWIIEWDTTASVQSQPANVSGEITGYHFGKEAGRGDYYVEYVSKKLSTPDADCTHVIHISVLHIKNATIRDAGTYACGDEWQKATLYVVDTSSSLDACDFVIIIIGLVCVVGWCLAVVEFGVLICMCLQKPKHAERRRRIVRRVSVLLPQSRRAAYNVRMNRRRANRDSGDGMVQHVPRSVEVEPEVEDTLPQKDRGELYVNLTENRGDVNSQGYRQEKPKIQKVTFGGQHMRKNKKSKRKGGGNNPKIKKRPDTLAVVKPFGVEHSETSNPIFDGGSPEMYMNYPQAKDQYHTDSEKYAQHMDSEDIVSTPL